MATLWEIVTGNSTLPVQAGVTFWDHLNNQQGGGGGPTQYVVVEAVADSERQNIDALVEPLIVDVHVDAHEAIIDGEIDIAVEVDRTEQVQ